MTPRSVGPAALAGEPGRVGIPGGPRDLGRAHLPVSLGCRLYAGLPLGLKAAGGPAENKLLEPS